MTQDHPAMVAARGSWSAVQRKAREEWLALMAEDVCIEDPVGKGHCGKQAVRAFWERTIEPNRIRIEVARSFCAGQESAHLMTLTTTFPNGASAEVTGIFTYRVNDAGKLVALRGYWQMSDMKVNPPS